MRSPGADTIELRTACEVRKVRIHRQSALGHDSPSRARGILPSESCVNGHNRESESQGDAWLFAFKRVYIQIPTKVKKIIPLFF